MSKKNYATEEKFKIVKEAPTTNIPTLIIYHLRARIFLAPQFDFALVLDVVCVFITYSNLGFFTYSISKLFTSSKSIFRTTSGLSLSIIL